MHLKRLEIKGFKSFADKTEIDFKEGITCIVGPNGSGKSNILDAIRWVLGEQSVKTLRGSKMEDVIFAGTDKRRPLGYGEVTIVFSNKDGSIPIEYSEVSITRRMFRSGESEYYINRNSCRLKDIKELFMDTGVGKDGYSIIGQGRVDEILSNKPEDRRNIFEEAAGIVKYKTKKEEAEKKLKRTEENLVRINDIVFELEKQLKPLEKQSCKANQYLKLAQELKELEINVFIREIDRLKLQLSEVEEKRRVLTNSINKKLDEKKNKENKYYEVRNSIKEIEEDIDKLQNNIFEIQNNIEKEKNKLAIYDEKENFNEKENKRLNEEIDSLENRKNELISEKARIQKEYIEYNNQLAILKEKFNEEYKVLKELKEEIILEEKKIEKEKGSVIENYNYIANRKSKLNSLNSFQNNIDKRIEQVKEEIKSIDIEKKEKEKILDEILLLRDSKKEEIESINNNIKILIEKKDDIKKQLSNFYKESNDNQRNLQGKISNYKLLKNMEEGYDGFYKSVKNVMKACKNDSSLSQGIIGVVADLLIVDEKYEKAIETVLGGSLQNIVTETEEDAKKIINYLKKHKLGRVTFLPITSIKGIRFNLNSEDKKKFNILGVASDLINYDKKYKNIFEYLLGRTLVVKNIDDGILVARRFNHSIRIVTLDGDVLNAGGSMTGGSQGKNTGNILNRKVRIDKLDKDIKQLTNLQTSIDKKILSVENDLKEMKKDISSKEEFLQNTNIKMIKIENEIEKLIQENEKGAKTRDKHLEEIDNLKKEKDDINIEKEKLKTQLQKFEEKNVSVQENIKNVIKQFEKKKEEKEKINNIVTNIKIELNSVENKLNSRKEKLEELNNYHEEVTNNIALKTQEKEEIYYSIDKIKEERKNTNVEIDSLNKMLEDFSKEMKEMRENKNVLMEIFYAEQKRLKNLEEEVSFLEKKINNLDVKEAKHSVQLENYHVKLLEDYELSYEKALEYKKEIDDLSVVQQRISNLKAKIKKLGTINLGAIDEYTNVKNRFNFMSRQRRDLLEGKKSLKEVIDEMENKMEEQFVSNFEKIRGNFKQVFSELFGGGKADIFLDDKKNVLTSGIKIIAQPPGKKPQSLSLLSGGEKSLTAVALLFAILKTKPTPFCILDEIDAALDEANINRYARYLKEFANNTQFIIITHRKNTMEIGDILYGVTMEEEGVSKIVSIELTDKNTEVAS